jgi:hypothetical protein
LATRIGRISTGWATFVALVVFLWPSPTWSFDVGKFAAVIGATALWLWSELDGAGEPHPHDVKLFDALITTVSDNERRRLAEHDMGNSFAANAFDGLGEIYGVWRGAAYEFQDRALQRKWSKLRNQLNDFTEKTTTYCGPIPGNSAMFTVKTHQDIETGTRSPLTLKNTTELNEAARKASEAFEKFERFARGRLRV